VAQLEVDRLRPIDADARAFLGPALREDEHAAVLEGELEGRRLRQLLAVPQIAEAARAHEVDVQHELVVVRREQDVLPAPLGAREAPALQRLERRVERLERRHVRRARPFDRRNPHRAVERAPQ
jgi:hypothetical protein